MAEIFCRWERRLFPASEFETNADGLPIHLGVVPLHTANGRRVRTSDFDEGGGFDSGGDIEGDGDG